MKFMSTKVIARHISLDEGLATLAHDVVVERHYKNLSEYISDVLRADIERQKAHTEITQTLKESYDSGISPLSPSQQSHALRRAVNDGTL